jgi:hypothetical protein
VKAPTVTVCRIVFGRLSLFYFDVNRATTKSSPFLTEYNTDHRQQFLRSSVSATSEYRSPLQTTHDQPQTRPLAEMSQNPASRRYVPSEIWGTGYDLGDLECYISNERFVLGRCDACRICDEYCISNDEIELTSCSNTGDCYCGALRAHGDAIIIATDGACCNNG